MSADHERIRLKELHRESYIWSLVCCGQDEESAKDVLQTVYLKIYEGKAKFNGKSDFKTWLFSVIKYTSIDWARSQKAGSRTSLSSLTAHPSHRDGEIQSEREERRREVQQVLEGLSKQQQEVLTLAFYQEMTLEEIAVILTISVGTVRTHYERGKENFRKHCIKNKLIQE